MTSSPTSWQLSPTRVLDLSRPRIAAILNLTPDSFADGGRLPTPDDAVRAAERAEAEGADMLDLGGQSTRPGAARVDEAEQIRRVVPAVRALRAAGTTLPMSVDTTRAAVAAAALDAGADAVNDVSAGTADAGMLRLVAGRGCALVLMHRAAPPEADSYSDRYGREPVYAGGVVASVRTHLAERLGAALEAGVRPESIVLDPGLGFGKSVAQNLELLCATRELLALGRPVLSALSRKSFTGRVGLGRDSTPSERLPATLALSVAHLCAGARLFRVHDVGEHAQALRAAWAVEGVRSGRRAPE